MLERVFSSQTAVKIILHIGKTPHKEFYLNELSKELKIGLGRTSTILETLANYKILNKVKSGNRILYSLNKNHALTFEIVHLANFDRLQQMPDEYKTAVSSFVRKYAELLNDNLVSIVIFGSVARGEAKKFSDIDILIIIKKPISEQLQSKLRELASEIFGTFYKYPEEHTYTQKEFGREYELPNDFIISVLKDGIIVYDEDNFLGSHLLRGIPKISKKTIEARLDIAKRFLEPIEKIKEPEFIASQVGVVAHHLARALLLLNNILPISKHKIKAQLESANEKKFAQVYKKSRGWFEEPPLKVNKTEVDKVLKLMERKYLEARRRLELWV